MTNRREARFLLSMATGPRADETCKEPYPIQAVGISGEAGPDSAAMPRAEGMASR